MVARRVTQKDIAVRAGVDRATVSLALRKHPSIPLSTRERIIRIAEEIGYVPDPMLTALSQYRHSLRPAVYHGVLAWLVRENSEWEESPHYLDYFSGAKSRAASHGYQLETVTFDGHKMKADRMASILSARSIAGILLCPQPMHHKEFDFPWEDFAAVTFGYSLAKPELHTVTGAHYRSVRRVIRELNQRNYRRIGLASSRGNDARVDNTYLAGYLSSEFPKSGKMFCQPFYDEQFGFEKSSFLSWLHREKPDVILTNEFELVPRYLQEAGIDVPGQIGVVCASIPKPGTQLTGIVENSIHIGEIAIDFLIAMINRGERGIPEYPQRIHVEGKWTEGATLRPRP